MASRVILASNLLEICYTFVMIKNIEFNNKRNEAIKGILKEKNKSKPLLIVGHAFNSSKEHPATVDITDKLYKKGYSTFSFDFSKSAQGFFLKEQVSDILDIVDYFNNYKRKILIAPSLGALSIVLTASQSVKIDGIITINGFFGAPKVCFRILKIYLLFRIFALFRKSYRDIWEYLKKYYKPEKIKCSALVIHAKHDEVVSISQSKKFFQKLSGKKEFYVLENADHHLTRDSYKQEIAIVVDQWIRKNFKNH